MEEIQGPDLAPALHDKVSSTTWRTWRKIQGPDLVPALQNRAISETVFTNFSGALESIPRNRFRQPM